MDDYMVKIVVRWIKNVFAKYGRNKPKQDIGMDVVGKVQKGVGYDDSLHHCY